MTDTDSAPAPNPASAPDSPTPPDPGSEGTTGDSAAATPVAASAADAGASVEPSRGVSVVLTIALSLLAAELIVILLAAFTIPRGNPQPGSAGPDGANGSLPPINDGRGRGRERRGHNPMLGDPDRIVDPAHGHPEIRPVMEMALRQARRLDARRATVSLELRCEPGTPLTAVRIECELPDPVAGVEAVEFVGPPAHWTLTGRTLVLTLDEPRPVWIGHGGWIADVTLHLRDEDPGPRPITLSPGLSGVAPATIDARRTTLPLTIPAVAGHDPGNDNAD